MLFLSDDRSLPPAPSARECRTPAHVLAALQENLVRGEARRIVASLSLVLASLELDFTDRSELVHHLEKTREQFRPFFPSEDDNEKVFLRMEKVWSQTDSPWEKIPSALETEALALWEEHRQASLRVGSFGSALFARGATVYSQGFTLSDATLDVLLAAQEKGKLKNVILGEVLSENHDASCFFGSLKESGLSAQRIPFTKVAPLMMEGKISALLLEADQVAPNGDTLAQEGSYTLAVLARQHGVPFYLTAFYSQVHAAPFSVRDWSPPPPSETSDSPALSPGRVSFSPGEYIPNDFLTALITDRGVAFQPFEVSLQHLGSKKLVAPAEHIRSSLQA